MALKLDSAANSPATIRILATAKLAGVDVQLADNGKPTQVPVLETAAGAISGAITISRYVAASGSNAVAGANAFEAASIDQWIEFASREIDLPASVIVYPYLGLIPNNAEAVKAANGDIKKVLDTLNRHLATRTYLVGHRVTLADVTVATSLLHLFVYVLDTGARKAFQNVVRWFVTIVNQPALQAVFGPFTLLETAQAPPAFVPKEEKKEEKKEAAKPKKEAKKEEEEEAEESYEEEKPKAKNPLDLLPPSKLIMDDWKRMYSNNDTRPVALPWFWEHYDSEGYSLWFCRYKYNTELEKTFMTANLIGGFLQRLDKLRKYGFGSLIIFGDEPTLEIEGAWLVRGTVVPPELKECDDYEVYDWKQVDVSDEKQKKLFEDFLAWDGEFAAREAVWGAAPKATSVNQGKVFK